MIKTDQCRINGTLFIIIAFHPQYNIRLIIKSLMSKEASKKCQMNYRKSVSKDLTFTGFRHFKFYKFIETA